MNKKNEIERENLLSKVYLTQTNQSPYWHYRFKYEKTRHSTKCTDKTEAEEFVISYYWEMLNKRIFRP